MKFQTVRVVEKHERLFDPDIDLLAVSAVSVLTCRRFFPIVDFYVGDGTGEEDSIGQSEKQKVAGL
jgi:hypothetical protein